MPLFCESRPVQGSSGNATKDPPVEPVPLGRVSLSSDPLFLMKESGYPSFPLDWINWVSEFSYE